MEFNSNRVSLLRLRLIVGFGMKREKQNMIKSENGQTAYFPIAVGWPQDTFS